MILVKEHLIKIMYRLPFVRRHLKLTQGKGEKAFEISRIFKLYIGLIHHILTERHLQRFLR